MKELLRVAAVEALEPFRLRMTLSDGSIIERDVEQVLVGPVFERVRLDSELFRQVRIEGGSVAWPGGADICPDVLIWNGLPPDAEEAHPAPRQGLKRIG